MANSNEIPGGSPAASPGGSYVQKVREDTSRILADLKSQNERLRSSIAALESDRSRLQLDKVRLQEQLMNVREDLSQRIEEHNALVRRLSDVEEENEAVSCRFLDIETQNTNLANLYVAGYQLHGSLDRDHVMGAIREIIINLIGSEDFGIFERSGDVLNLIGWFEEPSSAWSEVRVGSGIIGEVASTGESYFPAANRTPNVGIAACVPLKVDDCVTGVIALFRLLPQKQNALQPVDEELLNLLASQAGIALHCTRLHQDSSRASNGGV
jgi:GAF domain-containing protein